MTIDELWAEVYRLEGELAKVKQEIGRRAQHYLETLAVNCKLTPEEIQRSVEAGQASFTLPLVDYAAVMLAISRDRVAIGAEGKVRFYPNIHPIMSREERVTFDQIFPRNRRSK